MDIKISKSARTCMECERDFQHEEEMCSAVRIVESALKREDFCGECWKNVKLDNLYSSWTPVYIDPEIADQEPPETFSPLRKLFYESLESEDRELQARAFLAAQLLRRQKVFRLIKEAEDAGEEMRISLYNDRIGNRLVEVRDPAFSYAEMDAARSGLVARLQELEAPAPAPAEAAPEAADEENEQPTTMSEDDHGQSPIPESA